MYLENLVFDALDPHRLGRFWETVLGTETLTDEPAGYETRLHHPGGPELDLCFQVVPEPPTEPPRLRLELRGGADRQATLDRLLALGAQPEAGLDEGRLVDPGVVLGDPEGNPFRVVEEPATYADTGPVAALVLESADPERDGVLWQWLTGWAPVDGVAPVSLRHPSGRGPALELRREREPKGTGKNRLHLDVRLEAGDDPDRVARGIAERGGREVDLGFGTLPWRHFRDGSGNELCVLPARG